MFEIRNNTQTQNSKDETKLSLNLKGQKLFINVEREDAQFNEVLNLKSYSMYKVFQTDNEPIYFVDVNRITSLFRLPRKDYKQLPNDSGYIFSIKTGMISDSVRDILIDNKDIKKENIKIISDMPYNQSDLDFKLKLAMQDKTLLDYFSLSANGQEYKADSAGNNIDGDFDKPIIPLYTDGKSNLPFAEFVIQKYLRRFEAPLNRDIDNDEVTVESSAGLVNTRRAYMQNGITKFRLYPFGYEGKIKIKIGRRWYENLNEYNLILGGA
ncbi:MAG: hypothetical protein LBV16_06970 [Elusimicrobiota bacterium]|jgi:hypothetical protein|nr:hypothetical protein [Elusimicrobiota bacterium]